MKRLFNYLFGKRPRVIDMPDVCPRRFDVSELKAALLGEAGNASVQAVLQLLTMQRLACLDEASKAAWEGKSAVYHLGGAQALEDLLV